MAVYATYTLAGLREALERTDLFLVAEVDGEAAGLLMIIVPDWTDAAEITDLAVDIAFRRLGAGRALVDVRSRVGTRARISRPLGRATRGQPRGDLLLHRARVPPIRLQRPHVLER